MNLTEEVVAKISSDFLAKLDDDERKGCDGKVDLAKANAEIAADEDQDPADVAEAIWNAMENADEILPTETFSDLVDVVEAHWDELGGTN